MFTKTLQTDRLLLRPFTLADIQPSYEMETDPEISKYTHDGGVKTYKQVEQLIRQVIEGDYAIFGFGRFAVEHLTTGEFIGFCGLKYLEDLDGVDLGYRLKRSFWGQGLATEACRACIEYGFEERDLAQMLAFILPENVRSKRVLEKLGFAFSRAFLDEGAEVQEYVLNRK
ncbi:MAG: GNAT family N-acetyltransferase [Phaeodactylibacter sp.]|nr:GNAT family N-acetyltransferase [Phaeodactylibacter sp.]